MVNEKKGFGVTARSTTEARRLEPTGITCFRQADVGEYLREVRIPVLNNIVSLQLNCVQEDTLFTT